MQAIVVFGGGGALGAFDAGVWAVLAPAFAARGIRLAAVAGTSIGALNAALVATAAPEDGVARLLRVWRAEFATPSLPFTGLFDDPASRSWNGVLTGLLVGNRSLYRSAWERWTLPGDLDRRDAPLLDRRGMWAWLEALGEVGTADGDRPLLGVAAVDVLDGALRLFDNAEAPVRADHLAASAAIPVMFEPVGIDGRLYWDGDMTRESIMPLLLDRLRARGVLDGSPTLLVVVDHMSRAQSRLPRAGLEFAHRALELLLQGKTHLPETALENIDRVVRIEREPLPEDLVSGQFDYSPARVEALIAQGRMQAEQAWSEAAPVLRPEGATRGERLSAR